MPDLLTWASNPARRRPLLRLLVAAQVLYVLGVAGAGYATTALGQHVVLATTPVDPRDLLHGDFVRLRYVISDASLNQWHDAAAPRRRQGVFVLLAQGPDSLSTTVGVYPKAPTAAPGQAVLRAWITDVYRHSLTLRFNLERYYVPEGSGLRLEKAGRLHPLRVHVGIAPWGQARIERVEDVGAVRK
ncbi:GDYXXLXY domain-containing protein [Hymenobacter properus]|uniref:GDYXXLXY domain-containing protein n=1 Tax=Hymenobacter properus TaxID=2791026 RepID=A0A931BEY8_9BACT|nr:GDYXXLXY domain-containing protein [Hymenobacter properus]MBF9141306.1 GDYXXLXY domain-containing protein [Hymenobacter properus]MBR7720116.1 GDYXXLXY domain-containing protein [Microvirga sp. SRT04]